MKAASRPLGAAPPRTLPGLRYNERAFGPKKTKTNRRYEGGAFGPAKNTAKLGKKKTKRWNFHLDLKKENYFSDSSEIECRSARLEPVLEARQPVCRCSTRSHSSIEAPRSLGDLRPLRGRRPLPGICPLRGLWLLRGHGYDGLAFDPKQS